MEEEAGHSGASSKDGVNLCREKRRRAKGQLELSLASAPKDNRKCFSKYSSNKRRMKENLRPLLDVGEKHTDQR